MTKLDCHPFASQGQK